MLTIFAVSDYTGEAAAHLVRSKQLAIPQRECASPADFARGELPTMQTSPGSRRQFVY